MDIRLLKKEEGPALEELAVVVSGEKWRPLMRRYITAMFDDGLAKPVYIVAEKEGKIIGCAAISEELFTVDIWGISWVNVHPDHERQGIGQRLVEACWREIQKRAGKAVTVILDTYPGKTGLYDKTGFQIAGNDHAGGCLMIQHLGKAA